MIITPPFTMEQQIVLKVAEKWIKGDEKKLATESQIKHATDLLRKLGYNPDYYDFELMTKAEANELINELKNEWGNVNDNTNRGNESV